jgi:glycosyltransferase involved in cell wall biosynthesis
MSSQYPTITCFCPLYKGGQFIEGYMEDMVRQTIFPEVNFFILDCASPDNEIEVINDYAKHNNIVYLRLDKDPGLYAAWNVCINSTQGDFLSNWNVDDRKSPWSLEIMRDSLVLNEDIDLVYGNTIVSKKANEDWAHLDSKKTYICNETNSWKDLLLNNNPHCMPMWRRAIHDKYGHFNEKYATAADADLWLKAAKKGSKMKKIDDIVGIYYHNPKGRSSDPATLQKMVDEVTKMRQIYEPTYTLPVKTSNQ